jgi:hypothetical protein
MTNIHHTIVKGAAQKGVKLEAIDQTIFATMGEVVVAMDTEEDMDGPAVNELARDAWDACANIAEWNATHEGFRVVQGEDGFYLQRLAGAEWEDLSGPWDTWGEAIEAFEDAEIEEEADEDADEDRGSVVPSGYKTIYREIGIRKQDNGDFLARLMADYCLITDGKKEVIDCEKVEALASRNGVDYPLASYNGYVQQTRGWEGRYRMTIGNMLRKRIADAGKAFVPASLNKGKEAVREAPQDFCDKYRTKPKQTKAAKAEAAKAAEDLAS